MTNPDPLTNLSFSEAAPIPDHTASGADETPPLTPPPNPGATTGPQRKRLLPGKLPGTGTGDNSNRKARFSAVNGAPKGEKERKPLPPIPNSMKDDIEGIYALIAMSVMITDPQLSETILLAAPKCAEAWVELARKNHTVRRILLKLLETSAWGAVASAHAPIFMLMFKRMTGSEPRFSMVGDILAKEVHPDGNDPDSDKG